MRHADLRREEIVVIAKAASALLYDTAVWYLVWVCGHMRVFCGGMSDAMGSKNSCKTFSTEFFDWQIQSKSQVFRLDSPVGKLSRKKLSRKKALPRR